MSPSDPNLSYGTAALANDANCGKCYELTFTSGPVGKRMIVRIANQGSDVGSLQFDIAIPGGGVGIFDACTKQFGSSPPGARYGGVSSAQECGALPAALQPGCRWRFEWFMGADNPTFMSRETSCDVMGK